jgi:hypothetical protein
MSFSGIQRQQFICSHKITKSTKQGVFIISRISGKQKRKSKPSDSKLSSSWYMTLSSLAFLQNSSGKIVFCEQAAQLHTSKVIQYSGYDFLINRHLQLTYVIRSVCVFYTISIITVVALIFFYILYCSACSFCPAPKFCNAVAILSIVVFRLVTPCCLLDHYQHFGTTCHFHLLPWRWIYSSEILVTVYD